MNKDMLEGYVDMALMGVKQVAHKELSEEQKEGLIVIQGSLRRIAQGFEEMECGVLDAIKILYELCKGSATYVEFVDALQAHVETEQLFNMGGEV